MLLAALSLVVSAVAADIRVEMLDVGQADSILIRSAGGKNVLIDAGEGQNDVVSQLRTAGVDHLDLVIATHPHADHIGGMEQAIAAFPPKVYVDSGLTHTTETYRSLMRAIEGTSIGYRTALTGTVFNLDDGAKIEILLPGDTRLRDTRSDLNANSVVTRLTHGSDCFLFTGDAEAVTEQLLIQNGITQCDVLKVAHHGSEYSSTQGFLDAVRPKIALVSVGTDNRYHHPGRDTMDRLTAMGISIYRTDLAGAVTLTSTGHGVTVQTQKASRAVAPAVVADASSPRGNPGKREGAPANGVVPSAASPAPGATAATLQPGSAACAFIASRNSEVFHESTCGNGLKINAENLVCYASKDAAVAAGRRSAGCCHP